MILITVLYKIFAIALAVVGVGFLIAFHELGHFSFCKLFKIKTPSFSIGFGPRIFEKKIGDTTFALSAIPLGGYVEIAGAQEVGQGDQKEAHRSDDYSFDKKPYYQKMLVISGGIAFNLFFAYFTLTMLFSLGVPPTPLLYPKNATNIIEKVRPKSAAEAAGLQVLDKVVSLNGTPVSAGTMQEFNKLLKANAQQTVTLTIERGTETIPVSLELGDNCKSALLAVRFASNPTPARPFVQALKEAVQTTNGWIMQTFAAFGAMFKEKTTAGLGGPLAMISSTASSSEHNFATFLIMLCFISVGLAVLNVIPLPIFDGGQALFYTLEAITGRSLDAAKLYIHYASWGLVILLTIYLTGKDLLNIFWK